MERRHWKLLLKTPSSFAVQRMASVHDRHYTEAMSK